MTHRRAFLALCLPALTLAGLSPADARAAETAEALRLVNAHRRAHGLSPLSADPALVGAAVDHARAMAGAGVMSHDVGGAFHARMRARGLGAAAENIAMGQRDVPSVFASWRASSGHNANMLSAQMRRMGLSRAVGADGRPYWAMILAR